MKKFLAVLAVVAIVAFAAPAFAANPFMDVPAGHWAYDAVAQLAAKGIVSGYPDGAFKGAQPATRYEVASVVARALAKVDAEKASKQDLEMLKKLVMEFKDELDALGVKVDKLDKRVAVLEDNLGGWKLRGTFVFDAKFGDKDTVNGYVGTANSDNAFTKEKFWLVLTKQIDENTSLYARYRTGENAMGNGAGMGDIGASQWDRVYVDTKLPYDVKFRVGRFMIDFENDKGLYYGKDANPLFGSFRVDGFRAQKSWGMLDASAIIARNTGNDVAYAGAGNLGVYMNYILDLQFNPNEKFFAGATGYWFKADDTAGLAPDTDFYTLYAGFNFTPAVALKGMYYWQKSDVDARDSQKAWKVMLDVKQSLLKFTSLWLEYDQQDNRFLANQRFNYSNGAGGNRPYVTRNIGTANADGTSKMFYIVADQKWNDKWSTFLRYAHADLDDANYDDAKAYGIGVNYQYTPAIAFQLAYDATDYGSEGTAAAYQGKDSVIMFRTTVNF